MNAYCKATGKNRSGICALHKKSGHCRLKITGRCLLGVEQRRVCVFAAQGTGGKWIEDEESMVDEKKEITTE